MFFLETAFNFMLFVAGAASIAGAAYLLGHKR
jgi:hypothetical protein